jgi:hypothetical protein
LLGEKPLDRGRRPQIQFRAVAKQQALRAVGAQAT